MIQMILPLFAAVAAGAALGLCAEGGERTPAPDKKAESIYDFTVRDIDGEQVSLSKYRGQVCLIVNVASR